jgi:hypothetical protein
VPSLRIGYCDRFRTSSAVHHRSWKCQSSHPHSSPVLNRNCPIVTAKWRCQYTSSFFTISVSDIEESASDILTVIRRSTIARHKRTISSSPEVCWVSVQTRKFSLPRQSFKSRCLTSGNVYNWCQLQIGFTCSQLVMGRCHTISVASRLRAMFRRYSYSCAHVRPRSISNMTAKMRPSLKMENSFNLHWRSLCLLGFI